MTKSVSGEGWRIPAKSIKFHDEDSFIARYRYCDIEITREKRDDDDDDVTRHGWDSEFYITVRHADGCYLYEGYFGNMGAKMFDAIEESLMGSQLIPRRKAA